MEQTHNLEDLITYVILSDKKEELQKLLEKEDKNIEAYNNALDGAEIIATVMKVKLKDLENYLAHKINRINVKRLHTSLELIKVNKQLIEIELRTYTED